MLSNTRFDYISPLSLAERRGHENMVDLLRNWNTGSNDLRHPPA